jgi:hypothetical protein
MSPARKRLVTKIGVVSGLALSLGAVTASTAGAAAHTAPRAAAISVTPSTGLTDGQNVTVSGSGLTAGTVYHVGECAAVAANSYACAPTNVDVTASSSGAVSTPLTVLRTYQGHDVNGKIWPVDCTTTTCVVGVFDSAFAGGSAPISFG